MKSIRFSANQAHIIGEDCILCGQCFVVCPQNAKQIVDETEKAKVFLLSGAPVYVSLAPSFAANYAGVGINRMRKALKRLGFADVEETAIGATMVKREYERILREEQPDVLISSCCHSLNLLVQKYFPARCRSLRMCSRPCRRTAPTSSAAIRRPRPYSSARAWQKGRGVVLFRHGRRRADL